MAKRRTQVGIYSIFYNYEDYFINDPEKFKYRGKTDNEDKKRLAMARFLFNKYSTPKFLDSAWTYVETVKKWNSNTKEYDVKESETSFNIFDRRLIYICLATGKSLYKEYFKSHFTKKETHIFSTCKHNNLTYDQVRVYTVAFAESGSEKNAMRLARSKIKYHTKKQKDVIQFLSRQEDLPITKEIDDLYDYIKHRYNNEEEQFSIVGKGYTLKSLIEKKDKWHRDLTRMRKIGLANWDGYPIENKSFDFKLDGKLGKYHFKQILNTRDLQKEGNAMRHCVLGYKHYCLNGETSIWTMTREYEGVTKRCLTIEVSKDYYGSKGYQIIQSRGLANRSPRPNEQRFVTAFRSYINQYN